jgi:hypothetical protein
VCCTANDDDKEEEEEDGDDDDDEKEEDDEEDEEDEEEEVAPGAFKPIAAAEEEADAESETPLLPTRTVSWPRRPSILPERYSMDRRSPSGAGR